MAASHGTIERIPGGIISGHFHSLTLSSLVMLSFCRNSNETIDFCGHEKYFSLLSYASQLPQPGSIPHPLSVINFRAGLPISTSLISTHHTVIRASYLKAHLNIPFSMDTFERFHTSYRHVPGPRPWALFTAPLLRNPGLSLQPHFPALLASYLHLTWLNRNTAQSIQFHRCYLCPECPHHPS